jgi:hypothetical protein
MVTTISRIIFKNLRGSLEMYELRVNFEQVQGLLCKVARIFGFWNYFPWETVVDSVHGLVDRAGWPVHGSTVDSTVANGWGLPELGLTAATACHEGGNEKGVTRHDRGTAH